MNSRWKRSNHGIIAGVCSGLANTFDIPSWVVRFVWILSTLTFGSGILFYIMCSISLPREDKVDKAQLPIFLGVCSRLNNTLKTDIGLLRLFCLLLTLFSFGFTLLIYIVLHFLINESKLSERDVN